MNERPDITNFAYLKSLPGIFVCAQLVLCFLAFVISVSTSSRYNVHASHGFFSFTMFLAILSCLVWIFIHIFKLHTLFKKDINWNFAGLLHNSVWGFLVMAASWAMIDIDHTDKSQRAAGVFGFLAYSVFVAALVWEMTVWQQQREDDDFPTATAQVVPGLTPGTKESSRESSINEVHDLPNEWNESETAVNFVGMKTRPTSFYEQ